MISLGLQLQFVILPIVTIVLLVTLGIFIWLYRKANDSLSMWGLATVFAALLGGGSLIACVIIAIPFDAKYWQIYETRGSVEQVTTAVQAQGKYVTNYYTVRLTDDDRFYVLNNPRTPYYQGRNIDLACTIAWVYQGADQYNCEIRA